MIAGTQTASMAIGSSFSTSMANGSKTALYSAAAKCSSGGGTPSCGYVLIPVIADSAIGSGSSTPIKALACLHIITGVGGSAQYIKAQFIAADDSNCKFPASSGYGPISYGAVQPPRLVNYWGNTY